jgi:hypothetical protein
MFPGHLADLRADSRIKPKGTAPNAQIGTVVFGVAGWLVRLGLRAADEQSIDWRGAVRLEGDRLIVRSRKPWKPRERSRARGKSQRVR